MPVFQKYMDYLTGFSVVRIWEGRCVYFSAQEWIEPNFAVVATTNGLGVIGIPTFRLSWALRRFELNP